MSAAGPGGDGGRGLLGHFVRHRTAANLVMLLIVALGLAAAASLPRKLMPDVEIPTARVDVRWWGAGVEQTDGALLGVLDGALARTPGLERRIGTARDNGATLALEFEPGADLDRAMEHVRARLDTIQGLPEGADPPEASRGGRGELIADFVISGPAAHRRLALYGEELQRRFSEAGMVKHWIPDRPNPAVAVDVSEAAMVRHGLTLADVTRAVRAATDASPVGFADDWRTRLTTGRERRTPETLADLPMRRDAEGEIDLRLGDVAMLREIGLQSGKRHYVDGEPAVLLRMLRKGGGDGIDQLARAEAVAAEFAATLPEGVTVRTTRTDIARIDERLAMLLDNALVGLGVVLALLFLFLSARAAFWVAAGIPVSLLGALAGMWALGVSLNLISVFALIIMLGMIVDDAIVVGEHADALARRGLAPAEAAELAARRMAGPVVAASVTTAIAFGSVLVVGGAFGRMLEDLPIAVGLVLLASLIECFVILPAHMAHAGAAARRPSRLDALSGAVNRGFEAFTRRVFRPALEGVVRWRYPALGLAVFLLLESIRGLVEGAPPWRFWAPPEPDTFTVNVAMTEAAEREDTVAQVTMVEAAVRRVAAELEAETGVAPLDHVLSTVGGTADGGLIIAEGKGRRLLGGIEVALVEAEARPFAVSEMLEPVRAATERHPLAEAVAFRPERRGPAGDALSVEFSGAEPAAMKAAAEALKREARAFPELVGLQDTLPYGRDELRLTPNALARHLGLTEEALAAQLRGRFNRAEAAETVSFGDTTRILVGMPVVDRTNESRTRALIRTPAGDWLPLYALTDGEAATGFRSLRRVDGRLVAEVKGDVATDDAARAAGIDAALREEILPAIAARHGVEWRMVGLAEQERRFLAEARTGFVLGVLGIYAALAWVFGSWTRPMAVIAVIPFGLVGAVQGHVWMDLPLTMFSVVGLLGMTGIVVNDSIVLVTAIDEAARRRALVPALIEATCGRLRAVLLTTLTTVFGLAPMLVETSEQAQLMKPTVVTLVFGLGFGMLLVLLVTPALVMMQHDAGRALTALRRLGGAARRGRLRGLSKAERLRNAEDGRETTA